MATAPPSTGMGASVGWLQWSPAGSAAKMRDSYSIADPDGARYEHPGHAVAHRQAAEVDDAAHAHRDRARSEHSRAPSAASCVG